MSFIKAIFNHFQLLGSVSSEYHAATLILILLQGAANNIDLHKSKDDLVVGSFCTTGDKFLEHEIIYLDAQFEGLIMHLFAEDDEPKEFVDFIGEGPLCKHAVYSLGVCLTNVKSWRYPVNGSQVFNTIRLIFNELLGAIFQRTD